MNSRLFLLLALVAGLGATGALANWIVAPVWADQRAREPALRLESAAAAAGQGATLALLGGFRALVADVTWIRLHTNWEARDLPASDALVHVVPAIDPRPVYFWLNGARILAYDFAAWRIEGGGGYEGMPAPAQERIVVEQARRALAQLERARTFHPAAPELWIERASIELNRLRDVAAAAESYRQAAASRHAPRYAARLHAEMLRRLGRKPEALDWLVRLHPTLPRDDESAGGDLVLERIRDLERELAIPLDRSYRPGP